MKIHGRDLVRVNLIEDSMRNWHAELEFAVPQGVETVSLRVIEPDCLSLIGRLAFLGDHVLRRRAGKPV